MLLKAWILKVTLVLTKLQGESKAHFCVAWCYKIKAAICINLFNMIFFFTEKSWGQIGVQAILTS